MATATAQARTFVELNTGPELASLFGAELRIRGEIVMPLGITPNLLLICLPGGGMNRNYFDLPTPPGETEASFAVAMAQSGFAVAMLDPLGVGESSAPADPYELTPDVHVQALGHAVDDLLHHIKTGDLPGLPALPDIRRIGVGHSFGAALSVFLQASRPTYEALALFGFGVAPMPRFELSTDHTLPDAALPVAEARSRIAQSARAVFSEPYLDLPPNAGERGQMLARANDRLLATMAYSSMLPFLFQADAAQIDVPVLLAFGDRDLHGPPHEAVRFYPKTTDLTLLVLPQTRHNHFTYIARETLFHRLAQWAHAL
jgi:pimeloyl-ACP methyl ester carboxylesterase